MTDNGDRRKLATCQCGAYWGGSKTCHCARCHRTFTGLTAFDAHRPGHCDVNDLVVVRQSGNQQVWGMPDVSGRWSDNVDAQRTPRKPAVLSPELQDLLAQVQQSQAQIRSEQEAS